MRSHPQKQLINGYFTRRLSVNAAFKVLDIFGKLFFLRWKKNKKPIEINKLLIVNFGGFGDALLFTSVIDSLRECLPKCEIDVMTNKDMYHILQYETKISNFYVMENRFSGRYLKDVFKSKKDFMLINKKYDAAVCLRSFMDNGVLPLYLSGVANYIAGFSTGGFSFALDYIVHWNAGDHETIHYIDSINSVCHGVMLNKSRIVYDHKSALATVRKTIGNTSYVVVHFGSREKERCLSPERSQEVILWLLNNTDYHMVLTGMQNESYLWERLQMHHPRIIPVFGAFNLFEFIECISQSVGVVTVETFAAHVGAMCDVPVATFWSGVTDYRQWEPLGQNTHVIRSKVPCAPCFKPCEGMECMNHDVTEGLKQFKISLLNMTR